MKVYSGTILCKYYANRLLQSFLMNAAKHRNPELDSGEIEIRNRYIGALMHPLGFEIFIELKEIG